MSPLKHRKLNLLINTWPPGVVYVSSWLNRKGYSSDLLQGYKKSNWITTVGDNAIARSGDTVSWEGGVYALQNQLELAVHVGGKTSLEMSGFTHYVRLQQPQVFLFGSPGVRLPVWFKNYDWKAKIHFVNSNLFGGLKKLGITQKQTGSFAIKLSSPERAILEVLSRVPQQQSFEEAFHLMEGLNTLRPTLVQQLLENCKSIKVKRLFMFMAEKSNHPWVKKLNLKKIDFGKGKRSIVPAGVFDQKYQITVPKNYYPETEGSSK